MVQQNGKNAGPLARRLYSIFVYSDNPFSLKEMLKFVNKTGHFSKRDEKMLATFGKMEAIFGKMLATFEKCWPLLSQKTAFLFQNRQSGLLSSFFTLFYI